MEQKFADQLLLLTVPCKQQALALRDMLETTPIVF